MTDDQPTLKALQERAAELGVEGRSSMTKDELVAAIASAETAAAGHIPASPPEDSTAPSSAPPAEPALDPREPSPADVVGRPELVDVAQERAANRNPRVIGAPTQED